MNTDRRVLIVDNHDDVLCAFDKMWREAGYETVTTWSGIEALRFLRSANFNALFVDDYIADMHVGEFLKRASQLLGRTPIFVMQMAPTEKGVRFDNSAGPWPLVDKTNVTDLIRMVGSLGTNARSNP
jgi:CheY-like chemotaxis protein